MVNRVRYGVLVAMAAVAALFVSGAGSAHAGPTYCTLNGPAAAVQSGVSSLAQGGDPVAIAGSLAGTAQQTAGYCVQTVTHPGH